MRGVPFRELGPEWFEGRRPPIARRLDPQCAPEDEEPRLFRGRLDDGTEVLATCWHEDGSLSSVEIALRRQGDRTWGPPITLERTQ